MKVPVKFALFFDDLFLGSKNHGKKVKASAQLVMHYDREQKELIAEYNGEIGLVPNIQMYAPMDPKVLNDETFKAKPIRERKVKQFESHPTRAGVAHTAQVGTPHDHVFAGTGKGKTND